MQEFPPIEEGRHDEDAPRAAVLCGAPTLRRRFRRCSTRQRRARERRQHVGAVLAEQAERAGARDRRQSLRTSSSRERTTTSTWRTATRGTTRRARSRRASASPASTSPSTAETTGPSRRTPAGAHANCHGVVGPDPGCQPVAGGPIGTVPWYFENGLVSDGDPAVAFGPRRGSNGSFSWANGSRLYYANLTSNFGATRAEKTFKGFEAIAVSRTDNVAGRSGERQERVAAAGRDLEAVVDDVLRQGADLGGQRRLQPVLRQGLRLLGRLPRPGEGQRGSRPAHRRPSRATAATPGRQQQITAAANNSQRNPTDGCTIRTDSNGTAYVFGVGTGSSQGHDAFELMSTSINGGIDVVDGRSPSPAPSPSPASSTRCSAGP